MICFRVPLLVGFGLLGWGPGLHRLCRFACADPSRRGSVSLAGRKLNHGGNVLHHVGSLSRSGHRQFPQPIARLPSMSMLRSRSCTRSSSFLCRTVGALPKVRHSTLAFRVCHNDKRFEHLAVRAMLCESWHSIMKVQEIEACSLGRSACATDASPPEQSSA